MAYVDTARQTWRQIRHDADDSNNGETEFNQMTDVQCSWIKASADSASNGATTNKAICRVPYTSRVISAHWVQETTSTNNATSFATLTLNKSNGTTATMTAVGSFTTSASAITAYVPRAMTLTASAVQVSSGGVLHINIGKTSAGKKVKAGVLTVVLRRV